MQSQQKEMIKFLLFKWKQLIPFASIQRVYLENFNEDKVTLCPFNFGTFNPMAEINIIKTKIVDHKPSLIWSKIEYDLPKHLSDEDLVELYSGYNYMLIEKIKKIVYNR